MTSARLPDSDSECRRARAAAWLVGVPRQTRWAVGDSGTGFEKSVCAGWGCSKRGVWEEDRRALIRGHLRA